MRKSSRFLFVALLSSLIFSAPASARSVLQCVTYARSVSDISLHGNAHTWWAQAQGLYERGSAPRENSVLVFQSTRAMPMGHVAVVRQIVDARHVVLDHANWSRPGMIEKHALAEDISEDGDWSNVRVWYAPGKSLGLRANPTFGFIYDASSVAPVAPLLVASNAGEASALGTKG